MSLFYFLADPVRIPGYDNYYVDGTGNVYKSDMTLMKPFKSNKYLQVLFKDSDGNRKIYGVHQVVGMTFLNYYNGCIVHHRDEDTHNNVLYNLEIKSRSEHCRHHVDPNRLVNWVKENGANNKGKHPSDESRRKMSESAKKRHQRN